MEVQLGTHQATPRRAQESNSGYKYGTVEHAFMQMFALPETQRIALRQRIFHLIRLGLVAERPGKGQKIKYHEDGIITQWYFALILAHLRIDPELAVRIIKANWGDRPGGKRDDLDAAMRRGDITLADLIPAARKADRLADHIVVVVDFSGPLTGIPSLNYARASDLELIRQRSVDAHRGLFAIFDLSARLQEFSKALARGCPDRAGRPDRVHGRRGRPPAKAAPMMVSASDTVDILSNAPPFPLE
jgi:hypothetical protein